MPDTDGREGPALARDPDRHLPLGARRAPGGPAAGVLMGADVAAAPARAQGHHPRRRLRHAAVSGDPVGQQAAAAGLRQADDLLPAVDADAGGHPRHPGHLHAAGPARVRAAAGRRERSGGSRLSYAVQPRPTGWRRRSSSGATSSAANPSCLVLGDNIFYGHGLERDAPAGGGQRDPGATVFGYHVQIPSATAWSSSTSTGRAVAIEEKPAQPAVATTRSPGSTSTTTRWSTSRGSSSRRARGELEITDVNAWYLQRGELQVEMLGRGTAWLDTGTHESLLQASHLHRDDRAAAGPQDRLPRGDRLPHGLHRRRSSSSAWPMPLGKTSYGQYLLPARAEEPAVR